MSAQIGRDAVDGYVWLYDPSIIKGGGPERVTTEDPPDGWEPRPFLGFTAPCANHCRDGVVQCWSPGGPCEVPNAPGCDTCGACNICAPEPLLWDGDQA